MRTAVAAASITPLLGAAVLGVLISSIPPATAAEGDLWAIDRQNVNVRSGPSTSTDVLMTINPGARIVEIAAKGEWFFVEFPDQGRRGWVYGPLLVKPGAAAAAPAPAETPKPAPAEVVAGDDARDADLEAAATPPAETTAAIVVPSEQTAVTPADATTSAAAGTTTTTAALASDQEPAAVKSFRDTVSELNSRAVSVAGISLFDDVRSTGGGAVQVLATETWANVPEAGQTSYMNALFDRWQSVANGLGPLSLQIVDPSGKIMMERSGS